MAGRTKRHQVPIAVVTAFCQWLDVMHLLRLGKSAFLQTLLTKRVCMHVSVTDTLPGTSVPSFRGWVSVVLFVAFGLQLLVLLTKPPVRQPGAARVGTGTLWFPWHRLTSLRAYKKPHRISPMRLVLILHFADSTIPQRALRHLRTNVDISGAFYILSGFSGRVTWRSAFPCHLRTVLASA